MDDDHRLTINEAAQLLDIGRSRIHVLIQDGRLHRVKDGYRAFITRASAESYQQQQQFKRHSGSQSWPPSRSEQRAIVETLLLAGVITKADISQQERDRLAAAVRKTRRSGNSPCL